MYEIVIQQADGATAVTLNGVAQLDGSVPLVDDHGQHRVEIVVRRPAQAANP